MANWSRNTYNPFTMKKKVYDLELNFGTVIAIDPTDMYPIKVRFESGESESYTFEGKRYINGNQMLYTKKMYLSEIETV